jgi:DNA-binding transcriptional MerR regulator
MTARGKAKKGAHQQLRFYSRSVVCGLCGVTESELALWEAEDLIAPARLLEHGNRFEPLYDADSLRRIRLIRTLADELDVNVPGIGVILHLLEQLRG